MNGWMILAGVVGAWIGMWLWRRRRRDGVWIWQLWFSKSAEELFDEGTEQAMRGEYQRAIETLSRALELDPQNATAYMHRGNAYLGNGQWEEALRDFERSLELKKDAACYFNRSEVYLNLGQEERALEDLAAALELAPQDAEIYGRRATVFSMRGEHEKALADIERAIEFGLPQGHSIKAIFLERAGRVEEAIASWDRALAVKGSAEGFCRRGLLLERVGRRDEARRDLERAWKMRRKLSEKWQERVAQALERLKL